MNAIVSQCSHHFAIWTIGQRNLHSRFGRKISKPFQPIRLILRSVTNDSNGIDLAAAQVFGQTSIDEAFRIEFTLEQGKIFKMFLLNKQRLSTTVWIFDFG